MKIDTRRRDLTDAARAELHRALDERIDAIDPSVRVLIEMNASRSDRGEGHFMIYVRDRPCSDCGGA
jgi:hypothetical protein